MAEEKQLTPAREKITANYKIQKQKFLADGYEERQETISVLKANLMALVTAGPIVVIQFVIWILAEKQAEGLFNLRNIILLWVLLVVLIFVHELLHGLGWGIWTEKKWKSISLGIMWESFTPYCHCKEPLKPKQYLFGCLTPFLVLGIGMFILSLATGNPVIFVLGVINTLSAGGDTTIACMLFKYLKYREGCYILDHPTDCGFIAFVKH